MAKGEFSDRLVLAIPEQCHDWQRIELVLRSAWALVPALFGAIGLVVRTALEDAFFLAHLDGYRAYADPTRFRLIPGAW